MGAFDSELATRLAPVPHSLVLMIGMGQRQAGGDIGEALVRSGVRALWIEQVEQALAAAAHARFDAAVIRLDQSVAQAARRLHGWRQALGCPLLLLAEIEDEVDEIIALELGADGLLAQPVSPRRLRAHLLMLLRRGAGGARPPLDDGAVPVPLAAGGWRLDRVHNRLQRAERAVDLTEVQAALMQVLMADLGRVVPRSSLLAAVSRRRTLQTRSVDVYVARLRLRLLQARVEGLVLEGVRGRGYRLSLAGEGSPATPVLGWTAPRSMTTLAVQG